MEFALNFDGHKVEIGKMLMLVTEQTIAKSCRLMVGGERWWKKEHVVTEFVNQFLLPDKQNPDWRRGIPRSRVRPKWHIALVVIHRHHLRRKVFIGLHLPYQNTDASKW